MRLRRRWVAVQTRLLPGSHMRPAGRMSALPSCPAGCDFAVPGRVSKVGRQSRRKLYLYCEPPILRDAVSAAPEVPAFDTPAGSRLPVTNRPPLVSAPEVNPNAAPPRNRSDAANEEEFMNSGQSTVAMIGIITAAVVLTACGNTATPGSPSAPTGISLTPAGAATEARQATAAESYMADLQPLNAQLGVRPVQGKARFQLIDGQLTAMDEATGLHAGMIHPQHIHAAAQCPPASADTNGDGFVGVIEGLPFYGAILVPLDSDLTNQASVRSGP